MADEFIQAVRTHLDVWGIRTTGGAMLPGHTPNPALTREGNVYPLVAVRHGGDELVSQGNIKHRLALQLRYHIQQDGDDLTDEAFELGREVIRVLTEVPYGETPAGYPGAAPPSTAWADHVFCIKRGMRSDEVRPAFERGAVQYYAGRIYLREA